jgi:agmatine deiminase
MSSPPSTRLPSEWAPQSGVQMTWPRPDCDWGDDIVIVEPVFAAIASRISHHEKVIVTCQDAAHQAHVAALIEHARGRLSEIVFPLAPSNDVWARDHGPITVFESGKPLLLDFAFNGWGGKYPADLDNRLTRTLHVEGIYGPTPLRSDDFVLEGGSIDSDGQGTLLTTTRCLLAPTRNTGQSQEQVEARLHETLGIDRVLWLEHGFLAGDDTDSHVDMLARFCNERTIAYTACDDPGDEHFVELQRMAQELAALRTADGRPYRLVPLPLPHAKRNRDGDRLPASYTNFLIINGAVLAPVYSDPADEIALDRLRDCFPDREIVEIPCLPLIAQYGSLHCATMQLPAGVL